ncbi:MAG: site-specific DNA-methyltransferase [Dehalococcoidia bacterium]|nr:site-specific DNA-methyltransferase [Dehalococcoidia bacterium]
MSYGDRGTGNAIIHGENLTILKALSQTYRGQVRCIYIDPPYNNQENYTHYRDKLDHDTWLESISASIALLVDFLADEGSLWVSIDDTELHYLKVAIDKIFGRQNFVSTIVWEHRTTRENRKVFSNNHEYILVYAKDARAFKAARNSLGLTLDIQRRYHNPDNDPRGPWQSVSANVQAGHGTASQFYELVSPNGKRHKPPLGRCWVYAKAKMEDEIAHNNIWFGNDGNGAPRIRRFLPEASTGLTPHTLWTANEVGTTTTAKKHLLRLFPNDVVFDTPKPEALLRRIIEIASNPGDLILDAFLGSGTTLAVAHKTDRHYIGIERGPQAVTHAASRLRQVVDRESGGISEEIHWEGGGGFDFYRFQPLASRLQAIKPARFNGGTGRKVARLSTG